MQQNLKASSSQQEVLIGPYRILKTLGTGNFAQVKLAVHLHTEVQVALKTLEKDKKNATLISNELEIMKLVDHPNITRLFHVMETTEHICMVMEYASGGDLAGRIIEVSYIHEEEARHIFTQIVCAVNYCHVNGIAHRDIKPENILMDANRNIKLCDFGLAIKVNTEQKSTVFCGTLPYCAPELFSIQSYDPRALDIWSMGVVLYIMVTKHYPFKATTYDKMKEEMQDPHYYIPPKLPAHVASLIVQLFTIDPMQRPKIGDIMKHQWLQGREEFSKINLSQETLTSKPNPCIMAAMGAMGYNPKDITDSLYKKKFNSIMATYLILKHQSPCTGSTNHKVKLKQPSIDMIPTDPPTVHLFLKKIGSKTDNATSASPTKDQSHKDDKLVRKDSKNHGMTDVLSCQQTSPPSQTPAQCGPVQHPQELLLNSSLQKRGTASSAVSCGPVQCDHEQLLNRGLQKKNVACSAVACGPGQYDNEQLLNSSLQKRGMASKAVSCGSVQHDHAQLPRSSLQKRSTESSAVSCHPEQHDDEHPPSSSRQKRSTASSAVSCHPEQHDDEHPPSSSRQKRSTASSAVSYGPVQHDDEHPPSSSRQRRSTASSAVSYGPVQHGDEHPPSSHLQKRNMAPRAVSCSPVHHDQEQLLNSSLQKRGIVSKAVSCGPVQYDHGQLLSSSSLQKRGMVSKAVSCGPGQHDHGQLLSSSSLQKRSTSSSAVSCGLVEYDDEQPLSSSLRRRNTASSAVCHDSVECGDEQFPSSSLQKGSMASRAVPCDPVEYDDQQPLSSSLQKRGMVPKAMSCGPVQYVHEQLLSNRLRKRSMTAKVVSCSSMQHDHEQLLSSSLQKKSMVSKTVSCGPVQYEEQLFKGNLQRRSTVSKAVSYGPVQRLNSSLQKRGILSKGMPRDSTQHGHEQLLSSSVQKRITLASSDVSSDTATSMGILSEYHISQEDPQGESLSKCSSCLHNIASVWSSEEMTAADSHYKDRSLSLQETSEPNFTSAQSQCVTTASPQNLSGGWKRAKRRMVKCLRRLCCCLPAQRRSCTSQRRVVPRKAGESGVTENQVSGDSGVTQNQALLE